MFIQTNQSLKTSFYIKRYLFFAESAMIQRWSAFFCAAVNPHTPVAQKTADELVFRGFQGEGVEFFKIGPHWPPLRFLMRIFWKIPILALPSIRPLKNFVLTKRCEKKWSISNLIMVFTKFRIRDKILRTLIGWQKFWRHANVITLSKRWVCDECALLREGVNFFRVGALSNQRARKAFSPS